MRNILFYSDIHINQSSLKECISILEEISMLANKYNCDTLINLGDTFDGLKPSSQELDVFATFIKRLGTDKQHIILAANSHESTTQEESILNHYGILSNNIRIVKEFKDNNHLFCGHFVIKESNKNYGAKISKINLKDFVYVFLGHQHSKEIIKPNICHIGSCRWINFDEIKDKFKIVVLITGYGTEQENVHFLKLNSPIPMVQIELDKKRQLETQNIAPNSPLEPSFIEQGSFPISQKSIEFRGANPSNSSHFDDISLLFEFLNNLNNRNKVKIVVKNFENYRNLLPKIGLYQTKFSIFKVESDFEVIQEKTLNSAKNEMTSFKESFTNYLKTQKIDDKIKEILQKEIE